MPNVVTSVSSVICCAFLCNTLKPTKPFPMMYYGCDRVNQPTPNITKWLLRSLFWTQSMVRPYGFVVFDNEPPNWCCSISFHMMCYNSETANLTKNNNNELLVAQSLLKTNDGGNIWRCSIWQWTIKIGVIQLHERPSLECNRLTSVGCSSLSNITSLYVLTFIMHAKFICIW